jgi:hypothetical protein
MNSPATATDYVGRATCDTHDPKYKWRLTMDDELKSDYDYDVDHCLSTGGLFSGDWKDSWNMDGPAFTVSHDGAKVYYPGCKGTLVGEWDDLWGGVTHKVCMEGTSVTAPGASGTYDPVKKRLTMNFAGVVVGATVVGDGKTKVESTTEESAGCYLAYCNAHGDLKNAFCKGTVCGDADVAACKNHWETYGKNENRAHNPTTCMAESIKTSKIYWDNQNVWTKKSDEDSVGSIDGSRITWHFFTGTETGTLSGDKIYWDNTNTWYRQTTPSLLMVPCSGSADQKWTLESSGNLKSQKDDMTCLSWGDAESSESGVVAGPCLTEPQGKWEFKGTPSWVTEA